MNPQDPKTLMQHKSSEAVAKDSSPMDELMVKPIRRYDLALEPQSDDKVLAIAERCAKMKLAGCSSVDDAYLRILAGRALGLPAMASVQGIFPIDTKTGVMLGMYVKLKLALALSRPDVIEYVRFVSITKDKAVVVGKRVGQPEAPPSEFTMEDAVTAGLVDRGDSRDKQGRNDNNYNKHPKAMLAWRACGRLLDQIAADILHGIASVEDLEDAIEPEEPRGELPASVKEAIPARDWAKEAEALKAECLAAFESKSNAALKAFRTKFAAFEKEAPAEVSETVQRYYNVMAGEVTKAKGNGKPATAAPAATGPAAPAATTPAQAPAAGAAPARSASPYLPPHQRGDSYDGPDTPEPPFPNG